jgi:hypothetical protein
MGWLVVRLCQMIAGQREDVLGDGVGYAVDC